MPGSFETAVAATPLFCHQEFLERLETHRNSPIGKRATLLLQHLAIDSQRQHYKATSGVNKGWRRSRLGGNHGSHFYAWWAPASAQPLRKADGFATAPEGSIILRDIRHHDDHSPVTPQDLMQHYLPLGVSEIRHEDFGPAPWTPTQAKFAGGRARVRLLKGHPGSGKTTALLHAADTAGAEKTLYVTYSRDLAVIARAYFDRYCSKSRQFQVMTYPAFLREITGSDAAVVPLAESRKKFQADVSNYSRSLGPWSGHVDALYDEFHAHLAGAALPIGIAGRFEHCRIPRASDKNYRERRSRFIGDNGVTAALEIATRLERMDPARSLAERYFPELLRAWQAGRAMMTLDAGDNPLHASAAFRGYGCIAVDECQDLTPVEAFVLALLSNLHKPNLLLAGDEAQTVRPTDFEWAWLNDILHSLASGPTEYKLTSNLRSPRRLAMLVNHAWDLYGTLEKRDRPSGAGYAEIEDDSTDQLFYCAASPCEELNEMLRRLADRPGLALITLDATVPASIPAEVRGSILTAAEVKGLDFHSVCILDGGRHLQRITSEYTRIYTQDVEALRRRLAIDQLRVALSRPTERLIWLDIAPTPAEVRATLAFLNQQELVPVTQSVPGALLKALEEEELDLEERIQRCLHDARQLLDVKPDLAWSRAMLAAMLLGSGRETGHVSDGALRQHVHSTAAEICFTLAMRGAKLGAALGAVDLFEQAARQCMRSNNPNLRPLLTGVRDILKAQPEGQPECIYRFATDAAQYSVEIPPWFLTEIQPRLRGWVEQLESSATVGYNATLLFPILQGFYEAVRLPDAAERVRTLREKTLQTLVKAKRYSDALALVRISPRGESSPSERKLEATCLEKTSAFGEAAKLYRELGDLENAVDCYRQIPDVESAYELMRQVPGNTARESYDWMMQVREVFARRPANFNRVMLGPEKKALEALLEQGLGVQKKVAVKKTASATKKKAPTSPAAATAAKRAARKPPLF